MRGNASAANIASIYGTTGIGTLDGSAVTTLTGTASAVVTALSQLSNETSTFSVTLSGDHSVGDLKSINNATDGSITVGNSALDLTGSAADIAAALDGITGYTGNITLTATSASAADIATINTATNGTIDGSAVTTLTGTASAVVTALSELDTDPTSFDVTLDAGTASAANIASIHGTTGIGTLDGAAVTTLTGTASAVVTALSELDTDPTSFDVTLDAGTASAANIASIHGTTGIGTLDGSAVTTLTGTASAVVTALSELDTDPTSFDVTLDAGTASAANIASIHGTTGIGTLDGSA